MPNVVPPPSVLQGAVGRPQAQMPPMVAPARAVAITNAKTSAAAQAVVAPKRRRSFTGESRASAEKSRTTEPARPPHRARRRTFEDEATVRQPLNDAARPSRAGRRAGRRTGRRPSRPAPDPSSIFDDLDEDTRVLQTKPGGGTDDLIDQAFERLRTGNAPGPRPQAALVSTQRIHAPAGPDDTLAGAGPLPGGLPARPHERSPAVKPRAPAGHDGGTRAPSPASRPPSTTSSRTMGPIRGAARPPAARPGSGRRSPTWTARGRPRSAPSPSRTWPTATLASPRRPRRRAPSRRLRPRPPTRRVESLPALRVAVLATSIPGEVRLIALDPTDEAPPGAALAVLVPLTPADGDSVTRLFGGLE